MATKATEIYSRETNILGESPMWSRSEQTLYWLDIARKTLHRKTLGDLGAQSWTLSDYPGCIGELALGSVAVAMGIGIHRLDLISDSAELLQAAPARRAGTRFNDGKVDPRGRLWAGTMQNNFRPNGESIAIEEFHGALYRFDIDDRALTMEDGIGIANTLAWSTDASRFYFGDSLRGQLYFYDFNVESGVISGKRLFFESSEHGVPDGSTIDVDGCLWNARWDAGQILRITPEGRLDRVVDLPVPRPTNCCFGGPNLDILYVTSATLGLSNIQRAQFPLSGSVFAITGLGQGMPIPQMKVV